MNKKTTSKNKKGKKTEYYVNPKEFYNQINWTKLCN